MLETPQRVALIGSFAPSLIVFRGPLISAMVARGHRVTALAPAIDAETATKIRVLGAEPKSIQLQNTSLSPLGALRSFYELRAALRDIRPDLVIAYTIKPVVLGALAARAERVGRFAPLVTGLGYAFTEGTELKRRISRIIGKLLYKRAFARAEVAVFQNSDDLNEFRRLRLLPSGLKTVVVAGSGVDLDHFAQAPLPPAPSFLMIARLLGDKGVREYGLAAKRLKTIYPELRISLAGWIDPSPNSISQAELNSIVAAGVEFLGRLDDVREAIAAHSVYVLPSYREGTPRSVLEAMAMGRPIITTDAPGCRETVAHGVNGLLVPPRNADALFEAMLSFVKEPHAIQPMGEQSRRLAEQKFDVHRVNEILLSSVRL